MNYLIVCQLMKKKIINSNKGFTLIEVVVAIAIIAIALTAALGSQSQGISLAGESKFYITASLLAQRKMAEIEVADFQNLAADSGEFEEPFSDYRWNLELKDPGIDSANELPQSIKQIDLSVIRNENDKYIYTLRLYKFIQDAE